MTAIEMLYEFELSVDRISSKGTSGLSLPAKISYLNRGQISFALSKYGGSNKERTGFEETEKRIQDLQVIHVTNKKLLVNALNKQIYTADLTKAEKLMLITRKQVFASKGDCKDQWMPNVFDTQTDDLNEDLQNPNRRPSFEWREVLTRIAENKLQVFTDSTFTIESVVIDYLRYPRRVDVTGYEHFDASASANVDSEFPEYAHQEIVAMAAVEWQFDIANPAGQSAAAKLALQE